jgi:hypothetical protein
MGQGASVEAHGGAPLTLIGLQGDVLPFASLVDHGDIHFVEISPGVVVEVVTFVLPGLVQKL